MAIITLTHRIYPTGAAAATNTASNNGGIGGSGDYIPVASDEMLYLLHAATDVATASGTGYGTASPTGTGSSGDAARTAAVGSSAVAVALCSLVVAFVSGVLLVV